MKRLLPILCALLLYAAPVKSQAPVLIGTDSIGFTFDSTMQKKVIPSMGWIFEVKPKPIVLEWWYWIASCQKLDPKDTFGKITFFIINQESFGIDEDTGQYGAYWAYTLASPDGTYVIFLAASIADSHKVSMHEMTHVLENSNGLPPGHDKEHFGKCGLADGDPL